jgi:predicted CXXCH cytochrome family protein
MVFVASAAFAGIQTTKHNLSTGAAGSAGANANQEICVYCHTPHNAQQTTALLAPLWSHSNSVASYTTYTNTFGTLNGTIGQPGSVSKACLSCHDGTVAVGNIAVGYYQGNKAAGAYGANAVMTGNAVFGVDLSNDHPIGIVYVGAAGDAGLYGDTTQVLIGALPLYPNGAGGVTVECGSCHNVHNNDIAAPFLRMSNTGSALCLTCHNK